LRAALVEGREEFLRRRPEDQALVLVFHAPARQAFHVELVVGRRQTVRARLGRLLDGTRRELVAVVRHGRVIDHFAGCAERHRAIRIALARHERVAHRDHQHVFHGDRFGELAPIRQLHLHLAAGKLGVTRIRHALEDERALARMPGGFALAAARLPAPAALAGAGFRQVFGGKRHVDRVCIGQDVVFLRGAPGILPLAHRRVTERARGPLVADHVERVRGPAEARALVALACGRLTASRRRLVGAVRVVQLPLGAPHDIGRQWRVGLAARGREGLLVHGECRRLLEETERVLHLPDDIGGGRSANLKESGERNGDKPSGRREPTHEISPAPSTRQRS
jgi:hypothetical protein